MKKKLTPAQTAELFTILQDRFKTNMQRHKGVKWSDVQAKLESDSPEKLWSLSEMERTGGEPDIVAFDKKTGEYVFFDCSLESPKGRRSVCYDQAALESRKEHKPKDSALEMAAAMAVAVAP